MNSISCLFIFLLISLLTSRIRTSLALSEINIHDSFGAERQDLLELRDSLISTLDLHSRWTGPPCYKNQSRWVGITCANSRIIGINLRGVQLTGTLQPTSLQNVTYLMRLDLSDNALRGDLPTLKGLVHLKFVSLSKNRFSGAIPIDYVALPNLALLDLHDNLLTGTIPALNQHSLFLFNVSYNFLQGRIPDTLRMERFSTSSYDHNLELCGKPLDNPCPELLPSPSPLSPSSPFRVKKLELIALILVAVCAVMVPFMVIFCYLCYNKKKHVNEASSKGEDLVEVSSDFTMKNSRGSKNTSFEIEFFDKGNTTFNLDDLLKSPAEVLGQGKLGYTYRVTLESGPVVVVKRLRLTGDESKKELVHQMQPIGTLRHENLVKIIGYYEHVPSEMLVIYENVPNGSLAEVLHGSRGEGRVPLKWQARLDIAQGIARGLAYLHKSLASHKVPHANLKSSNILIHRHNRHQYCPKLTDFGFLPLLVSRHNAQKLAIAKTPEFSRGKRLTCKADMYCFGLVLLELITGHIPEDHDDDLPSWVTSVVSNEWSTDVIDLEIVAEKERHDEMLKLMDVGLQCAALEPGKRPEISVVVERIEEIREGRIN